MSDNSMSLEISCSQMHCLGAGCSLPIQHLLLQRRLLCVGQSWEDTGVSLWTTLPPSPSSAFIEFCPSESNRWPPVTLKLQLQALSTHLEFVSGTFVKLCFHLGGCPFYLSNSLFCRGLWSYPEARVRYSKWNLGSRYWGPVGSRGAAWSPGHCMSGTVSLLMYPGRQQVMTQVFGSLSHTWEKWFLLPDSFPANVGIWGMK